MKPLKLAKKIDSYITKEMTAFYKDRTQVLKKINLENLFGNGNPYSWVIENETLAGTVVKTALCGFLALAEMKLLDELLKGLAVFICKEVYGGRKSGITGIDLEFDSNGVRNIVTIKSGPNWGNSGQIAKMIGDFKTAAKTLRTSNSKLQIKAVNGCCYGRDSRPDKDSYFKYCGQLFWKFISGSNSLFIDIIEPLGHKAKEKNDEFLKLYSRMLNKFTREFTTQFCKDNGEIDWGKLVAFNSGK